MNTMELVGSLMLTALIAATLGYPFYRLITGGPEGRAVLFKILLVVAWVLIAVALIECGKNTG